MAKQHLEHESIYRGDGIVENRANTHVVFCGVGALGSILLDLLIRQGYTNITIIDCDKVEFKNFGTQAYGQRDVGKPKVNIAKQNASLRLGVNVNAHHKRITSHTISSLLKKADLVLDLLDNAESRNLIQQYCEANNIPCIHSGMSGDGMGRIVWNDGYKAVDPPEQQDEEGEPCEYPLASNLVHMTVGLTAEVVNSFVDFDQKRSVYFTLKDLCVETS